VIWLLSPCIWAKLQQEFPQLHKRSLLLCTHCPPLLAAWVSRFFHPASRAAHFSFFCAS